MDTQKRWGGPCAQGLSMAMVIGLALMSHSAWAAFTCTGPDGRKTFQDTPCTVGQQSEKLTLHQRNVMGPSADRPEHIRKALATKSVVIGMTEAEVARVFGQPDKVNANNYRNVRKDQLVYLKGADSWYVYTENGIVTAVQHRPDSNFAQGSGGQAGAGFARQGERQCPTETEIRQLDIEASRQTGSTAGSREDAQRRLRDARACRGTRAPSFGGF